MAYTKEEINKIFASVRDNLDISVEMFLKAKSEYEALGDWINNQSGSYKISIYPQGSFALGTVIKPISGEDDYDLDLVCEFEEQYGLSARKMKIDIVKPWLQTYKTTSNDIEEKRRCWHVEYYDIPNFHMDVIPSFGMKSYRCNKITDHDEVNDEYQYILSNPKGYIDWFYSKCDSRFKILLEQENSENINEMAEVKKIDRNTIKTPLQKTIQLLKRNRDIMFESLSEEEKKLKPISIIITTIAAQLYAGEDNVADALDTFLSKAENYIESNMQNGKYFIKNPSLESENFADKWNTHPDRANTFFKWLKHAKETLSSNSMVLLERVEMGKLIKSAFGENTGINAFRQQGISEVKDVMEHRLKIDPNTGNLSQRGTIIVSPSHHHGTK